MLSRRCFVTASASAGLACALGGLAETACGQTLARNARLLVGFPPGGSLDVVARLLAEHMKGYAPSIVVDNRPGAGGRIALEALKAGEPDGSLLALTPGDQVTLFPHVYQRLAYDALEDFVPVTTVCTFSFLLAVGPMVPASGASDQSKRMPSVASPPRMCRRNSRSGAEVSGRMQITPEQGHLLALLVRLIGARRVLEIGTFTGYSALAMALALPADGRLVACDISEEWTGIARTYWQRAGVAGKIDLRIGPALTTLAQHRRR